MADRTTEIEQRLLDKEITLADVRWLLDQLERVYIQRAVDVHDMEARHQRELDELQLKLITLAHHERQHLEQQLELTRKALASQAALQPPAPLILNVDKVQLRNYYKATRRGMLYRPGRTL